jgi:hypothetical protein
MLDVSCRSIDQLTRLNFHKPLIIEEVAEIPNDPRTRLEGLASFVVQDEIEVTLTMANLLVLDAERKLVKARRQEYNVLGEHAELTCIAVLGIRPAWDANDADPVSSPEQVVMFGKSSGIIGLSGEALSFTEDLERQTFTLAIVEPERIASSSDGHDPHGHAYLHIFKHLALLEMVVFLKEFANTGVDVKLVRVRVRILGLPKLIDMSRPNLEVLLG